jgi:hypothetical protein
MMKSRYEEQESFGVFFHMTCHVRNKGYSSSQFSFYGAFYIVAVLDNFPFKWKVVIYCSLLVVVVAVVICITWYWYGDSDNNLKNNNLIM